MNNKRALDLLIKHACGDKVDVDDLQAAVLLTESWLKKDAIIKVDGFDLNIKQE